MATFLILSFRLMFRMLHSILICEVANFLDWSFVSTHDSAPYVKVGRMTVSIIFLLRFAGIFLSFKKWLYLPNLLHAVFTLWLISTLISFLVLTLSQGIYALQLLPASLHPLRFHSSFASLRFHYTWSLSSFYSFAFRLSFPFHSVVSKVLAGALLCLQTV